ncbi:MAG: DUF2703 domain-containing protein [Candidatus Lokiarchaeota archaeon]|nr:DUF2703 domain-containing protein [Candidatus Lokiarchaeota archaeon]
MNIELLYSEGCHTWERTLEMLKQVLKDKNIDVEVKLVKIETQEDAEKHHYFGSPQININGKDIDPMAEKVTSYKSAGCRLYIYKEETYELPPKEMLEEALDKIVK